MTAKKENKPKDAPRALDEIEAIVGRAKKGDATVLPRLRELLVEYPRLWQHYGNLATHAEMTWVILVAGTDLYLRECLLRQTKALRTELGGPDPSPMERLLVERAVACWLQLHYFQALEGQAVEKGETPRLAHYCAKRQEQAQRMYLAALAVTSAGTGSDQRYGYANEERHFCCFRA